MDKMPLFKRFVGSIIDKVLILFVFVATYFIFDPYGVNDLGIFIGSLSTDPFLYNFMPSGKEIRETNYSVILLFILANIIYYSFFEFVIKASPGKRLLGGLLKEKSELSVEAVDIFKRAIAGTVMMAIGMWFYNLMSILYVTILFFIALDLPVFITHRSLIDILSGTIYINTSNNDKEAKQLIEKKYNHAETDYGENQSVAPEGTTKRLPIVIQSIDETNEYAKPHQNNQRYRVSRIIISHSLFFLITISIAFSIYSLVHHNYYKKQQENTKNYVQIKDCDIYIKKGISKLFATQVDYESTDDPDPIPKGIFMIGYRGQGNCWKGMNCSASLYVYDISNDFGFFDDEDDIITMLYNKYEESIQNCGYRFVSIEKRNCKGLSFESIAKVNEDGAYVAKATKIRSVIFANKKFYVLDVVSRRSTKEHSSKILQSITTDNIEGKLIWLWLRTYSPLICMIIFCLAFIIVQLKRHYGKSHLNKMAHILFLFSEICAIANIIAFIVQWFYSYDNERVDGTLYLLLFGISLLFNLTSTWIFIKKSESEYASDFLVPKQVKNYLYKRSDSESERKSVTAFVFYPLWVVGQLPFGLFILLYTLPLSLFIFIGIESRNLYRWLYGRSVQTNEYKDDISTFKDYYLILDLSNNASSLEIEKSFNQKMAQYNSATERNLNEESWLNLQEAYRVLISENRLRPTYDLEYSIYDKAEFANSYVFVNKKLERDINLIRGSLRKEIIKTKKRREINVVFASLLIWIIAVIISLSICMINDNKVTHKRNPYDYDYDYNYHYNYE